MSCKYCDIKMRPLDEDVGVLKGESWKGDGFGDGGYIGQSHDYKFQMVVYYDAGFACTVVPDIKFCPFCGEELKLPAEPLIEDEKIRKAVRAWAEVNSIEKVIYCVRTDRGLCSLTDMSVDYDYNIQFVGWIPTLKDSKVYTIAELCGEEEK